MTIESDVQKLNPGKIVVFFIIDATSIGGSAIYLHSGKNALGAAVVWQGQTYTAWPIEASGFELSGRGVMPQPKLLVADVASVVSALALELDDLLGAKVTRKRTFAKYLDAVNFAGGINADADPVQELADEVWFVNRKAEQRAGLYINFELSAAFDLAGKMLPGRQCLANTCQWLSIGGYRGAFCGYAGGAVADANDVATSDLAVDDCGGRVASCKLRFGANGRLPFGGFPGAGLVR